MAKPNTSQEPSMEEILASIRRIISDDTPPPQPVRAAEPKPEPAAPPPSETVSEDDLDKLFSQSDDTGEEEEVLDLEEPGGDDVLELTEELAEPEDLGIVEGLMPDEAEISFQEPEDQMADEFEMELEPEPEPAPPPPPPPPPRPAAAAPKARPAEPAVDDTPLVSPETTASISRAFGSLNNTVLSQNPRTIDDLVKDMLRPMLKEWLDENLPPLVERLVRAEIERVSRGR